MNANTALKINDAIDQAVRCGESITDIQAQVTRAIKQAQKVKWQARLEEAQARVERLQNPVSPDLIAYEDFDPRYIEAVRSTL